MKDQQPIPLEKPTSALRRLLRSPLFWLFALVGIAYLPIFFGEIVFFRDPAHWNYPARAFVRRALLNGEFPNWNPFVGLGVPVWANPLYAILYPPNWLLLIVPERLVASALSWQSAAHTLWGGLGLFFLARQFRCSQVACLVAGLAWAFSGYTTSMWSAGLLLIAGAWLPWVAVGMLSAAKEILAGAGVVKTLPKVTIPIALALLTGEVFIAMMSVGFGIATLVAWLAGTHQGQSEIDKAVSPKRSFLRVLGLCIAGIAIAFLIGSIVIAPARALVAGTPRAGGIGKVEAERYSFHPIRMLELVAPDAMGVPLVDYPGGKYAGEKAIDGSPLAFSSYLGASVVALALLAFGRGRRTSWILLGLWLFFLFVCFGRYSPVHSLWRSVAVPFKYMRYPEKYVVLLVAWTSLLAALGFDRLLEQREFRGRRLWWLLVGFLCVVVVTGLLVEPQLARYMRGGVLRGIAAAGGIVALLWLRRRQPSWVAVLVVAVVALDLASNLWEGQPFASAEDTKRVPGAATTIRNSAADRVLVPRLYFSNKVAESVLNRLRPGTLADVQALRVITLTPNLGSVFGISTVPGYDAATLGALDQFWEEGLEFRATLLRVLSIEFALLPVKDPTAADMRTGAYEPLMDPAPGARLYRVKDILPRAYVAPSSMVLNDKQTLARLFTPDVASGEMVIVAAGQGGVPTESDQKQRGTCRIETFDLNHLVATCKASVTGIAVFVEQYSPGWSARIDGVPTKVLRVNHVMRGVPVAPGMHRIEMAYHPPIGFVTCATSATASLAVLVLLLLPGLRILEKRRATMAP